MAVSITYFVHGTTVDNENGIASGWNDCELSTLGIEQAKELKKLVGKKSFAAVFCSDLKRASDSAKLAFENMAPIKPDQRLRECNYGEYNGNPTSTVEPMCKTRVTERFPGGESYEDVKTRVDNLLSDLRKNYQGKNVAIVAHKAPQLALDVLLAGKNWEQAFAEDWRKTKAWRPGWEYVIENEKLKN